MNYPFKGFALDQLYILRNALMVRRREKKERIEKGYDDLLIKLGIKAEDEKTLSTIENLLEEIGKAIEDKR